MRGTRTQKMCLGPLGHRGVMTETVGLMKFEFHFGAPKMTDQRANSGVYM